MHPDIPSLASSRHVTLLLTRPLPWKRNEGHPGPDSVLAISGRAKPDPIHGGPVKGRKNRKSGAGAGRNAPHTIPSTWLENPLGASTSPGRNSEISDIACSS